MKGGGNQSLKTPLGFKGFVLEHLQPERLGVRCDHLSKLIDEIPAEDWPAYFDDALRFASEVHAATPFLVTFSRQRAFLGLPDAVLSATERNISRERMTLALLELELEAALGALKCPVIILKGMDLGRRFYPERILRTMSDVDLLVPDQDFDNAVSQMQRAGFHPCGRWHPKRRRIEMSRYSDGMAVELHSRVAPDVTGEAQIWSRAAKAEMYSDSSGVTAEDLRVMSAEDTLHYLIRHALHQHRLESVTWLNDIYFLVARAPLDWSEFIRDCRRLKTSTASWFVLSMLSQWGCKVPAWVLAELKSAAGRVQTLALSPYRTPEVWFQRQPVSGWGISYYRYLLAPSYLGLIQHAWKRAIFRPRSD